MGSENEIIGLLIKNEETIGDLYKLIAKKIPSYAQFFDILAQEEMLHASWIHKVHTKIEKGVLKLNVERFDSEIINSSIAKVNAWQSKIKNRELSLKEALLIALDLEENLIEANFFKVYEADVDDLKELLNSLKDAFIEHRDRIKAELAKLN